MFAEHVRTKPTLRILAAGLGAWIVLVGLPSSRSVRAVLMAPLYIHDGDASGELAYVMAGGDAYRERLQAASDLYHMRKIASIYILNEHAPANFNYLAGKAQTRAEAAADYLQFLGVPGRAVHCVDEPPPAWMSSLSEAQALSQTLPESVERIVVVTSAPHTRRSLLCFQRSLPPHISATAYAATPPETSAEVYSPIWQEYCKLFVYFFLA